MARIEYALGSDRRGPAMTALALAEALSLEHEVTLHVPRRVHALVESESHGRHTDGPRPNRGRFDRGVRGHLEIVCVADEAARGMLAGVRDHLCRFGARRPELVISDADQSHARAASMARIPLIDIAHDEPLTDDMAPAGGALKLCAAVKHKLAGVVRPRSNATLVPHFSANSHAASWGSQRLIGSMLRTSIQSEPRSAGDGFLVYLRGNSAERVLNALELRGRPALVYGLGERAPRGAIRFRASDDERFVQDLAACRALIGTPGSTLIGEALWLEKPILALPSKKKLGELANAHLIERMLVGRACSIETVGAWDLERFEEIIGNLQPRLARSGANGLPEALRIVRSCLDGAGRSSYECSLASAAGS